MAITVHGYQVDIGPEDGLKILADAELRLVDKTGPGGLYYNKPEINFGEEWISLCRTDLKDDVATNLCATKTVAEWREYYLKAIHYGVRLRPLSGEDKRRFSCIDSFSDG